jgi:hypothetical protein
MRYRNPPTKFLGSVEEAVRWLRRNIDQAQLRTLAEDVSEDYVDLRLRDAAKDYVEFAREAFEYDLLELYRGIFVKTADQIDMENLGVSWSRYENNAIPQFSSAWRTDNVIVIAGQVNPGDIDWERGFENFFIYGEDEWEATLRSDSPVRVVALKIEKEWVKLDQEIYGNTGSHDSDAWSPSED